MNKLVVPGHSHFECAKETLSPLVGHWLLKWCLDSRLPSVSSAGLVVRIDGQSDLDHLASASSDLGSISLYAVADGWRRCIWGDLLEDVPEDAVARSLEKAAVDDLLTKSFITLGGVAPVSHAANHSWFMMGVDINVGDDVVFRMLVDPALVSPQVPVSCARVEEICLRDSALPDVSVDVYVDGPAFTLSATDLLGLRPGDVLASSMVLDEPLRLRVNEKILPVAAFLGTSSGNKAVKLLSDGA